MFNGKLNLVALFWLGRSTRVEDLTDLARLGSEDIDPKRQPEMLEFAKKSEDQKFIQQLSFVLAIHKLVRVGFAL